MEIILAHALKLIPIMQANPRGSLLFMGLIAIIFALPVLIWKIGP